MTVSDLKEKVRYRQRQKGIDGRRWKTWFHDFYSSEHQPHVPEISNRLGWMRLVSATGYTKGTFLRGFAREEWRKEIRPADKQITMGVEVNLEGWRDDKEYRYCDALSEPREDITRTFAHQSDGKSFHRPTIGHSQSKRFPSMNVKSSLGCTCVSHRERKGWSETKKGWTKRERKREQDTSKYKNELFLISWPFSR